MMEHLEELGIDPTEHQSTQINEDLVDWADIILVMERAHLEKIESTWPKALQKVELLGKYISDDGNEDEILDPYGLSSFHYRVAQSQIKMAVDGLIKMRISI